MKTVNYKGEKIKVSYSNFNFSKGVNKIKINGKEYQAKCLPKYAGWEFEGISCQSEKQLIELIIKRYGI